MAINKVVSGADEAVKDIPDNATAVGNYAKVIHYNNAGNFANCGYKFKNYVLEKVVTRIFDI